MSQSTPSKTRYGPKAKGGTPFTPTMRLLHGTKDNSYAKGKAHGSKSGNARHDALNAAPVVPVPVETLPMPKWLKGRAKHFWQTLITPRQFAVWQEIDAVQYCVVRATWEAQWQRLQQEEVVLTSCSGTQYLNPRAKLVPELAKELAHLTQRLGLDQAVPVVAQEPGKPIKDKARFFG